MLAIPIVTVVLTASFLGGNSSPDLPVITEPSVDGQEVNAADVHMETAAFSDPDGGDAHLCSDWEIWTVRPSERVWSISCIAGVERVHTHLGDGAFEASHAGLQELQFGNDYVLRARHRDDSGDPATEWSPWGERTFVTGPAFQIFSLLLGDVADSPAPEWTDSNGNDIVLPAGGVPPTLRLESAAGELLLEYRGFDGSVNQVTNPPHLPGHVAVRVAVDAGGVAGSLVVEPSNLRLIDDDETHTILLPEIDLASGTQAYFWVAADGSTYVGAAGQTEPDFTTVARGLDLPWTVLRPGLVVEVFAGGFQLPVNIAPVPRPGNDPDDPFLYVTELYGTIKMVTRRGDVSDYATNLIDFNPTGNFPGSGEQGLTGIVVDPQTGDVFVSLLYDSPTDPGEHYPRVDRFTSVDGGRTAATQTTVLDMPGEIQGQSHQISNLSIGPDGKLYVHMGDGFNAATAQNLDSFRGKILRLDLDGSAPSDNPFFDAGDGINSRDYVYAYGLRNPFGGAWREADGVHYEVENGPSIDRFARVLPGVNYLWDGSNSSMTLMAIHNWQPAVAPVNIVFVQPSTFCGSGFPTDTTGHAFISESGPTYATGPQTRGKRITEFVLDAGGNVVSGPTTLLEYIGSGKATITGLAAGPDGLYFSDLYKDLNYQSPIDRGANVLRVRAISPSQVHLELDGNLLRWTPLPAATGYDLVRGSLSVLRNTGGDFTAATTDCLADDLSLDQIADRDEPTPADGFWYVVRDVRPADPGCYESGGAGQAGLRDPAITAAAAACP